MSRGWGGFIMKIGDSWELFDGVKDDLKTGRDGDADQIEASRLQRS
jgi:hypothetical protein